LVIIKPDNWRFPSTKPGNVIDILSRTGLRIVGCKIYKMPLSAAKEFYGPVQDVLREKLAPVIGTKAKTFLEDEFNVTLPDDAGDKLTQIIGKAYADDQFYQIIEFMSGYRPDTCNDVDEEEGVAKCMVLIYEGVNAIAKIRNILGPTDPNKAPSGTVRRDFGHNIMINTAHASDSPESVIRETEIIRINDNPLSNKILNYLNS
jgi:nucleoside diphosphate kinase